MNRLSDITCREDALSKYHSSGARDRTVAQAYWNIMDVSTRLRGILLTDDEVADFNWLLETFGEQMCHAKIGLRI